MGPAFYIIAILGCGEADAPCEEIGRTEGSYQTIAACTAATENAMLQHNDAPYPVVVAQCRAGNSSSLRLMSHDVNLPDPEAAAGGGMRYADSSRR